MKCQRQVFLNAMIRKLLGSMLQRCGFVIAANRQTELADPVSRRADWERADLVRYWLEFDLANHAPILPAEGILLDGGTEAFRLLGRGAGVTGFSQEDCLRILDALVDTELPPLLRNCRDVDVSALPMDPQEIGVPAWRGVWFPPLNRTGPARVSGGS